MNCVPTINIYLKLRPGCTDGCTHMSTDTQRVNTPQCPLYSCMWSPWQLYTEASAHTPPSPLSSEWNGKWLLFCDQYQGRGLVNPPRRDIDATTGGSRGFRREEGGLWKEGWGSGRVLDLILEISKYSRLRVARCRPMLQSLSVFIYCLSARRPSSRCSIPGSRETWNLNFWYCRSFCVDTKLIGKVFIEHNSDPVVCRNVHIYGKRVATKRQTLTWQLTPSSKRRPRLFFFILLLFNSWTNG